jgi:transketolase
MGDEAIAAQFEANLRVAMSVLRDDRDLVRWLSDRLLTIARTVPELVEGLALPAGSSAVFGDRRIFDFESYPDQIWKKPGELAPNRTGLAAWAGYVNSLSRRHYGRPLFIACSADLAESTNIAGFAAGFGDEPGWGWYEHDASPLGVLLPTEITEFANAGLMAGMATVNLAADPFRDLDGFWGACSTYGSFSYLKYGEMRLFSQLAQDCPLRVGKVLWVAGHSGPETAEDSRTHFGIFATEVTQLFPDGHVIDLHPWE